MADGPASDGSGRSSARLMELGVLERLDGRPPQPFLSARLVSSARGSERSRVLLDFAPAGASDRRRDIHEHVLELADRPRISATGGLSGSWCPSQPDGTGASTQVEVRLRSVLPSDAAWLSRFGFAGRPSVAIIEELATRVAIGTDRAEEVVALSLPRLPPHALAYRVGHGERASVWLRGPLGWTTVAEAIRTPTERLRSIAALAARTPWSRPLLEEGGTVGPAALVGAASSTLAVKPWGIDRAIERILRPPTAHDQLAFTALATEPEEVLDPRTIGPDLMDALDSVLRHVRAAEVARRGLFGPADPLDRELLSRGGAAWDPLELFAPGAVDHRIRALAERCCAPEGATALEIVELLDLFDGRCDRYDDLIAAADSARADAPLDWLLSTAEDEGDPVPRTGRQHAG